MTSTRVASSTGSNRFGKVIILAAVQAFDSLVDFTPGPRAAGTV
jgi:hypothetical protein